MSAERWERLKAIFHGALAQPPGARHAWLVQACGGDQGLLQEAETLLLRLARGTGARGAGAIREMTERVAEGSHPCCRPALGDCHPSQNQPRIRRRVALRAW